MSYNWAVEDSSIQYLSGFDPTWFPELAYRYLSIRRYTDQSFAIETGPYVGSIPLQNGDTFSITPRCGQDALARMLFKTERMDDALQRDFSGLTTLSSVDDNPVSWIDLLKESYLLALRRIEISGSTSDRIRVTKSLSSPRGRVNPVLTTQNIYRRKQRPFVSTFSQKTYATPERNVLSAAASIVAKFDDSPDNNARVLLRWARMTNWNALSRDIQTVLRRLNSDHFSGGRNYYYRALVMARLILLQAGISLSNEDAIESLPFMTNINDLFESYIRILFREYFSNQGFTVEKGDGSVKMFTDGTLPIKPDIVITSGEGHLLVADVKYKPNTTLAPADYYQIMSYMSRLDCNVGLLIKPTVVDTSSEISWKHLDNGSLICAVNLNMSNWESVEDLLPQAINQAQERIA